MGVPQYRKTSGYSSIKAALRCSSATCFAHKPLNASLRSFVHDCKGEVKLLMRCAMIGSTSYAMHGSTNSIARQVATVASRLHFDALPPHALRTSLGMLHFTLSSEDCKGEAKLLMRYATLRSISYAMHGSISYAMHGSTNSVARQVATVASRLRFDALPPHALFTSL